MSSFTTPLCVSPKLDGRRWTLTEEFTYHIGSEDSLEFIHVPSGFITDFASIETVGQIGLLLLILGVLLSQALPVWALLLLALPGGLYIVLPHWAKYFKGAVLHDYLYATGKIMGKPITRKRADEVFLEALLVDFRHHRSRYLIAYLEWLVVRLAGGMAWKPALG